MNNPASKEPSMDEILSSIRQIIADEDTPETDASAEMAMPSAPAPVETAPVETAKVEADADAEMLAQEEPFSLSADQMIEAEEEKPDEEDLPDIDFSPVSSGMQGNALPEKEPKIEAEPAQIEVEADPVEEISAAELAVPEETMPDMPELDMVIADDISFEDLDGTPVEPEVEEEPTALPDPKLSTDIAEKLLEPTTTAAVGSAFAKLGALTSIGGDDLTLDSIVREMLRPMLKEWLDENLPATVERMVEKEIERVSRGG